MAKNKELVRNQEQFLVRLPDGMRDRIKAKADRAGWSMNEAIVWCLEQHFPAPQTLGEKIGELIEKVALLKGDNTNVAVDRLVDEIDATLSAISKKTGYAPTEFRAAVRERYDRYLDEEMEYLRDKHEDPFDDANYPDVDGVPHEEFDWDAPPIDPDDPFSPHPKRKTD